jgi:hypothetical protein
VDPGTLPDLLAQTLAHIATGPGRHRALRVALDGPNAADPPAVAAALVDPLRTRGREAVVIDARTFWRDASVRLEHGREDVQSYAAWLDAEALRREVLDPASSSVLPALRDPQTNRSLRVPRRAVSVSTVVLVAGELLLGRGLPFDVTVHLAMTSAARVRRTDAQWQWTLPAHDRYDAEVAPLETADIVVRVDDPRHPAIS